MIFSLPGSRRLGRRSWRDLHARLSPGRPLDHAHAWTGSARKEREIRISQRGFAPKVIRVPISQENNNVEAATQL
jgi:hypothetical protein